MIQNPKNIVWVNDNLYAVAVNFGDKYQLRRMLGFPFGPPEGEPLDLNALLDLLDKSDD